MKRVDVRERLKSGGSIILRPVIVWMSDEEMLRFLFGRSREWFESRPFPFVHEELRTGRQFVHVDEANRWFADQTGGLE